MLRVHSIMYRRRTSLHVPRFQPTSQSKTLECRNVMYRYLPRLVFYSTTGSIGSIGIKLSTVNKLTVSLASISISILVNTMSWHCTYILSLLVVMINHWAGWIRWLARLAEITDSNSKARTKKNISIITVINIIMYNFNFCPRIRHRRTPHWGAFLTKLLLRRVSNCFEFLLYCFHVL